MRLAYIVTGELEDGSIVDFYGVCHSMERADELCLEAEAERDNPDLIYTWHQVVEEDD